MNNNKRRIALFLVVFTLLSGFSLGEATEEKEVSLYEESEEEKDAEGHQKVGEGIDLLTPSEEKEREGEITSEKEEEEFSQMEAPSSLLPKIHFGGPVYRNSSSKNITQVYLKDVAPWSFYHVWDRTLDPMTGSTQYMVYFKTDQGDYAFCMNPGLDGPQGNLPELYFPESPFKKRCESIATVGLSSGGIEGYSFEENFIFSQMYIWSIIPMEDGSPRYQLSFRNRENWVEVNKEVMERFATWKAIVDQRIATLGLISFQDESHILEVGKELVLTDSNGQLKNFNLLNQIQGLSVERKGNQLHLKATQAFSMQSLAFGCASDEYPLPTKSFLLQGHDDRYQDVAGFRDPYLSKLFLEAKEAKGRLRLLKKDGKGRVISGAVFELARDKDFTTVLEEMVTDEKGIALSKEHPLTEGSTVYLREKSVPEPYLLSDKIKEVSLLQGEIIDVSFVNESKKVLLKKVDGLTGVGVANVRINIRLGDEVKEYETNEQGELLLEDLPSGDYIFQEISAPPGYVLNTEEHRFTLDSRGEVQGSTQWQNTPRRLRILKQDKDNNQPLGGARFEIFTLSEDGEETKIKGNYREEEGSYFFCEEGDHDQFVTDEQGEIRINYLPLGEYKLVEVQAPKGYLLSEDGNPKEHLLHLLEEEKEEFLFQVENEKTKVRLRKIDGKQQTPIPNVEIELRDEQGKEEKYRTNEKGEILLEGLPQGQYFFSEVEAPLGYERSEETYSFTISETGGVQGDVTMVNWPRELEIQKLHGEEPLQGAVFQLLREDETVPTLKKVGDEYYVDEDGKEEFLVSDGSGKIHVFYLPEGNYYLREMRPPSGYVLDQEVKEIHVQGQLTKVHLQNQKTELLLTKRDAFSGKKLAGVELLLQDEKGEGRSYVTDHKGEIHLKGLLPGDYTILEPESLSGYLPLKEKLTFTLEENGSVKGDTVISNLPTGVLLRKKNEKGEALKNVGFTFYSLDHQGKKSPLAFHFDKELNCFLPHKEGQKVLYTDEKGEISLCYLPQGEYLLVETQAPKGYLPMKEVRFMIGENHSYLEPLFLEVVNMKEALPSTGEEKRQLLLLFAIFFSLAGLLLFKRISHYPFEK